MDLIVLMPFTKENGAYHFERAHQENYYAYRNALPDGRYGIAIIPLDEPSPDSMRNFYRGIILPYVVGLYYESGTITDAQKVHEDLIHECNAGVRTDNESMTLLDWKGFFNRIEGFLIERFGVGLPNETQTVKKSEVMKRIQKGEVHESRGNQTNV